MKEHLELVAKRRLEEVSFHSKCNYAFVVKRVMLRCEFTPRDIFMHYIVYVIWIKSCSYGPSIIACTELYTRLEI